MTIVNIPKKGDIAIKRKSDKQLYYVDADSITSASDISDEYEICAVVAGFLDGKALVVRPEGKSATWCSVLQYILSGYVLDGAEHSGTLSARADSSATANTDYVFTYSASTKADFVNQLRDFIQRNSALMGQEFYVFVDDNDNVILQYNFTFPNQETYFAAKDGFALTNSYLVDVPYTADFRRKNGVQSGEGVIANHKRALNYFVSDNSNATYNPTNEVTSVEMTYPICLPAYLGTSQYRDGDKCAYLRDIYGEGRDGWERFMRSFEAVNPCDYGVMVEDGKANTKLLASKRYDNFSGMGQIMCKAANYCYSIKSETINEGEFWLPSVSELLTLMDGVQYSAVNDRAADVLNKTLNLIGWASVSNGSNAWASCRYVLHYAWCSDGNGGFFSGSGFVGEYVCYPVSLYPIPSVQTL